MNIDETLCHLVSCSRLGLPCYVSVNLWFEWTLLACIITLAESVSKVNQSTCVSWQLLV